MTHIYFFKRSTHLLENASYRSFMIRYTSVPLTINMKSLNFESHVIKDETQVGAGRITEKKEESNLVAIFLSNALVSVFLWRQNFFFFFYNSAVLIFLLTLHAYSWAFQTADFVIKFIFLTKFTVQNIWYRFDTFFRKASFLDIFMHNYWDFSISFLEHIINNGTLPRQEKGVLITIP